MCVCVCVCIVYCILNPCHIISQLGVCSLNIFQISDMGFTRSVIVSCRISASVLTAGLLHHVSCIMSISLS